MYTYADPVRERDIDRIVTVLKGGGVIAYPTDLNWAFACDAASSKAIEKIYRLKPAHPKTRPFTLSCADISMVSEVANVDQVMYRLMRRILPGPYTLILEANRRLPKQIKDKRKAVGIQIQKSGLVTEIIKKFDGPLATTSVPEREDGGMYKFGYEVFEKFGHGLDLVVDLGDEVRGLESTVIDFTEGYPQIIREGEGDISVFE